MEAAEARDVSGPNEGKLADLHVRGREGDAFGAFRRDGEAAHHDVNFAALQRVQQVGKRNALIFNRAAEGFADDAREVGFDSDDFAARLEDDRGVVGGNADAERVACGSGESGGRTTGDEPAREEHGQQGNQAGYDARHDFRLQTNWVGPQFFGAAGSG